MPLTDRETQILVPNIVERSGGWGMLIMGYLCPKSRSNMAMKHHRKRWLARETSGHVSARLDCQRVALVVGQGVCDIYGNYGLPNPSTTFVSSWILQSHFIRRNFLQRMWEMFENQFLFLFRFHVIVHGGQSSREGTTSWPFAS